MDGLAQIKGFIEDRGKDNDGRLVISVNKLPKGDIVEFLEWLGNSFIEKGGLYAVDIHCSKGKYRVYKDKQQINQ